jgi:hypothetical protein
MSIYRKIYEQSHGPIPKGYHIHHKDGNHANNHIDNLQCVSPEEHYRIHESQGDYGACWALYRTGHLNISQEERSRISKLLQEKKVEEGNHNFLKLNTSERAREINLRRVENGTHNFLGGEFQRETQLKKVRNGTHHFLDGEVQRKRQLERVQNGSHPFLTDEHRENCSKRIKSRYENGMHPIQTGNHHFIKNNPSKIKKVCPHCNKEAGGSNYKRWHGDNCKMKDKS